MDFIYNDILRINLSQKAVITKIQDMNNFNAI